MALLTFLLWLQIAVAAPSIPLSPISSLSTRELANNSASDPSATLRITDQNGVDVSSSFQVRVFSGSLPSNISNSNPKNRRQGPRIRFINECLPDSFKHSWCTRRKTKGSEVGSLQSWSQTCLKFSTHYNTMGAPYASSFTPYRKDGKCEPHEVCMNTKGPPAIGPRPAGYVAPPTAMCMVKDQYNSPPMEKTQSGIKRLLDSLTEALIGPPTPEKKAKSESSLEDSGNSNSNSGSGTSGSGTTASFAISKMDGETPLAVDTLKFTSWSGADGQSGDGDTVQHHQCRGCTDLEVAKVPSDTDGLELDATLLTAGGMAGIVWIALMSG